MMGRDHEGNQRHPTSWHCAQPPARPTSYFTATCKITTSCSLAELRSATSPIGDIASLHRASACSSPLPVVCTAIRESTSQRSSVARVWLDKASSYSPAVRTLCFEIWKQDRTGQDRNNSWLAVTRWLPILRCPQQSRNMQLQSSSSLLSAQM